MTKLHYNYIQTTKTVKKPKEIVMNFSQFHHRLKMNEDTFILSK